MNDIYYTALTDRGVLSISGPDSLAFLQGIVTNDMEQATPDTAIYAAILTPQGKYLHDFFVFNSGDRYLIDCSAHQIDSLIKRLTMYRLRAQVEIENLTDELSVFSLIGADAGEIKQGAAFVDPRLPALGVRAIIPSEFAEKFFREKGITVSTTDAYNAKLIAAGVPGGIDDDFLKKSFPLELGYDELNAISFNKGCYVGQEVTARMKVRKLVKKRIVPVKIEGPSLEPDSSVLLAEKEVGRLVLAEGENGLIILRVDALEEAINGNEELSVNDTKLIPKIPEWFQLPD
ncbi:MAG: hypothetical protein CMM52_00140 [Rhodospirillaceae bacterium]|nr:hypothetical protein [Rhodospirillaceae bacterium]|tara:strand:- start:255 stop:1121 length:867 start_codon:yes stop_codon:yes gene_type:complete